MRSLTIEQMTKHQKKQENVRNVCILAHVDHGKTTLADSLVASNGIISQKMAGKLRYMDSRPDEQIRGITMKSSAITLHYQKAADEDYLVNLIDSPGHVDFIGEVSTAVRLCDGAIVVIDVVEGVCAQTKVALQQAWVEHIHPVLVLNKIDRLILERQLSPLDAYIQLVQILEQVNAITGELFTADVLGKSTNNEDSEKKEKNNDDQVFDWSSGLEETDDSSIYFSPEQGNVIFASALDGWGFGVTHFSKLYAKKLHVSEVVLNKTLWGDFYLNTKTKRIMKGAQAKAKKPLFVQFILENIWAVYDAVFVRRNEEKLKKIIQSLDLQVPPRDLRHSDPRVQLQSIFRKWLPLSDATLEMVCTKVPSPLHLSEERVTSLMCTSTQKFESLPAATQELKSAFLKCSCDEDAPVIVCISKMFATEKKFLPENKLKPLTPEEIAQRREQARQRLAEKSEATDKEAKPALQTEATQELKVNIESTGKDDTAFIAFARVFSGTIRVGQTLFVLGPKHDPRKALEEGLEVDSQLTLKDLQAHQHVTRVTIKSLYILMGRELEAVEEVPAGNVLGIGGLEEHVIKSATLSSTLACPPFLDLHMSTVPILRVALEPVNLADMPALVSGLKLLNQADPCIQVLIQETGEHVIVTAGEIHLQRCIDDLKERFAQIDINVSPPIVPFRETVIKPPKMDMVNELIEEKNQILKSSKVKKKEEESIEITTANKRSTIQIRAAPLPSEVTKLLEKNTDLLKAQERATYALKTGNTEKISWLTEATLQAIRDLKEQLVKLFDEAGPEWKNAADQIWSFGPRKCGPNILLNRIPHYTCPSVWLHNARHQNCLSKSVLQDYDNSFVNGFQLATLAGPLCEEPLMGVCFVVENWEIVTADSATQLQETSTDLSADGCSQQDVHNAGDNVSVPYGSFSGQIMSAVKEGCRLAFQAQPQRLVAAMYSCNIQVPSEALGKMYAVLGRRHGRVLNEEMKEGSHTFNVTAVLPVIESFDFSNEIRKQTSGMASPQLVFSHWEVVDVDPFWVPRTEEEYLHFGEKADTENRARKYVNSIRRRKGLAVDEKLVEHAEKQRTLTKNK